MHRAGKVALHVCGMDPVTELFKNQWRFAIHVHYRRSPCASAGAQHEFVQVGLREIIASCAYKFHHKGKLHMNWWDQHLAEASSENQEFLVSPYVSPGDSPEMNALKPTGWCVYALEQAGWKHMRMRRLPR